MLRSQPADPAVLSDCNRKGCLVIKMLQYVNYIIDDWILAKMVTVILNNIIPKCT